MSYFPDRGYPTAGAFAADYIGGVAAALNTVDLGAVSAAGALLAARVQAGGAIFTCGNGGSAAIANHLVCDCIKGARTGSSIAPRVHSLSSAVELITAIANDIGAEAVFAYQLESLARPGDILIAISSSGASPNIVQALTSARRLGLASIAMTGFSGGAAAQAADVVLHVQAENYGVIEDAHQSLMHILSQFLRLAHLRQPETLGSVKF
jgi:D-sedoheptulose 7-phosphate isomerase